MRDICKELQFGMIQFFQFGLLHLPKMQLITQLHPVLCCPENEADNSCPYQCINDISPPWILPASAWFRSGGRQDKKRVFGRECQNSGASGCDSQTLDGRSAAEQTEIYCRTLVQLSKMPLGGIGVTIGFPAAAAGEVAARIFDKAHHIVERLYLWQGIQMGKRDGWSCSYEGAQ